MTFQRFFDRVVLVTGGASGLGAACVRRFVAEGAAVAVADIDADGADQLAKEVVESGGRAVALAVDVTSSEQVRQMVEDTVSTFGRLDGAVNSAGIAGAQVPLSQYREDDFDRVLDVNLRGAFLCTKYELIEMERAGAGAIVNVASTAGLVAPGPNLVAYVASKHGVVGLSKAAAVDYAAMGIRVNVVCPGAMRTPMLEAAIELHPEVGKRMNRTIPMRRRAEPAEVAGAIAFLLSDDASFVTGHALAADGGTVAT